MLFRSEVGAKGEPLPGMDRLERGPQLISDLRMPPRNVFDRNGPPTHDCTIVSSTHIRTSSVRTIALPPTDASNARA